MKPYLTITAAVLIIYSFSIYLYTQKIDRYDQLFSFASLFQEIGSPESTRPAIKNLSIATKKAEIKPIKLLVTGDIMLGRYVNVLTSNKNNFSWPYQKTAELLNSADLTFINLESPLIANCPLTSEGMIFCGNLQHAPALAKTGVDIASVANNHAENKGTAGLSETIEILQENNIAAIGVKDEENLVREINGAKYAFLAYNDVETANQKKVKNVDLNIVRAEIAAADKLADAVIIMFHWGNEYTHKPTARQIEIAHAAIDAGADLVLGNHAHWVQIMEQYKDRLIMYSHGNFVFDQNWSRKTSEGVIGLYQMKGEELLDYQFISVIIEHNSQPRLATENESEAILKNITGQ